jgi:hypothetical protein
MKRRPGEVMILLLLISFIIPVVFVYACYEPVATIGYSPDLSYEVFDQEYLWAPDQTEWEASRSADLSTRFQPVTDLTGLPFFLSLQTSSPDLKTILLRC